MSSEYLESTLMNERTKRLLALVVADSAHPPSWWIGRLCFSHVHGRLRWERAFASGTHGSSDVGPALLTNILSEIRAVAEGEGREVTAYINDCLIRELDGSLGAEQATQCDRERWSVDDTSLKIWLPAALHAAIKWLGGHWSISSNDVVRNLLFTHLYGRAGYQIAISTAAWETCRRQPDLDAEGPVFSNKMSKGEGDRRIAPRTMRIREYGKSGNGFRLWLPEPMKRQIGELARSASCTSSEYARRVLIESVFGVSPVREHKEAGVI